VPQVVRVRVQILHCEVTPVSVVAPLGQVNGGYLIICGPLKCLRSNVSKALELALITKTVIG
jgi:hypothetical protein